MSNSNHYIFYDFETTGQNPCFDQAVRFAAIETNKDFEIIDIHNINIKLRNDILPAPKALLVNKLNISDLSVGDSEYEAFNKIHQIMNKPNTINIGYNSLNFDDIFLRFSFYRNLLNPYSHQYSSNFRADLYNIILIYYLYKHDTAVTWPIVNNRLSLRLESINAINNLYEGMSHDAEVDVHVTIELAKRLRNIDHKMWDYLISNFIKNNERNFFYKLPTITCIDNSKYQIGIFVSSKTGLKSNYCAPIIYLCESSKYKDNIILLRLDAYDFENFTTENFTQKIDKGILKKKFGEPHFILPFTDQYLKPINEHIITLAKNNLSWIKHNPEALKGLIEIHQAYEYEEIENIDIDASLYTQSWFSNDENNLIKIFHSKKVNDKSAYIKNIPEGRVKDLAIRIMGRNYFDYMDSELQHYYNKYLDSIFYKPIELVDFKGTLRNSPSHLLHDTEELLKKQEWSATDKEILNSIKQLILEKTRKQQDLGF